MLLEMLGLILAKMTMFLLGIRLFYDDWLLHTLDGLAEGRADSIQVFNTKVLQLSALQMLPLDNRVATGCSLEGYSRPSNLNRSQIFESFDSHQSSVVGSQSVP